ncbi:MAG: hypothetical protein KKA70_05350 [Proteobacteria bacterium]|nr:hypothetical protein [Pseudomonadota bacterium]
MKYKHFVVLLVVYYFVYSSCYAYDDEKVHPEININAANQSILKTTNLLNMIGFTYGLDTYIVKDNVKLTIERWIGRGGTDEDGAIYGFRYLRHFHNPLKPWDEAGLDIFLWPYFRSSIVWSQLNTATLFFPNYNSWEWAREYYYQALKTGDEKYFADTFKSVGHLTHLVADMAVPVHVRNDSHPLGGIIMEPTWRKDPYEKWASKVENQPKINYNFPNDPASRFKIDPSIFTKLDHKTDADKALAPYPISALWDQNEYTTANPDKLITQTSNLGLAEYTNANFFSKDTVFSSDFPHPAENDTDVWLIDWNNPEEVDARDGFKDNKIYIHGNVGDGKVIRLASLGYLARECLIGGYYDFTPYGQDDFVHEDYVSVLVPRAVGYSTALIDYFFRGTLDISEPSGHVYSVADGARLLEFDFGNGPVLMPAFTTIKAKVRNTTPDEIMQGGEMIAVARYKRRTDYQPDLSTDPPSQTSREADYSYSTSDFWNVPAETMSTGDWVQFDFDFSGDPIPVGITDLSLRVVFYGTLGDEKDVAVAVGMKNLSEPDHHVLWNSTDQVVIDNQLYTADQIRNDPAMLDYVDKNNNDVLNEISEGEPYIDPYDVTYQLSFSLLDPQTNQVIPYLAAQVNNLPAGRYSRLIILTDRPDSDTSWITVVNSSVIESSAEYYSFSSARAQEERDPDGNIIWPIPTPLKPQQPGTYRGTRQHHYLAEWYCWIADVDLLLQNVPCDPLADERPIPTDLTPYPVDVMPFP